MRKLISIELFKIFSKPRTYIGFGAIIVIVLAVEFGILIEGDTRVALKPDKQHHQNPKNASMVAACGLRFQQTPHCA